jgi:hypothetical protein
VIPRVPDLPDLYRGPRIFGLLGVADDDAVPGARMDAIADRLRAELRF